MRHPRIIKHAEVQRLQSVDAIKEELQREHREMRLALDAERSAILEEARQRAIRDSMQAATRIVVDAEQAAHKRLSTLEPQVAALVSATVAQVIGQMDQNEAVTRATCNALEKLKSHRRARILTAPDVATAVRNAIDQLGTDGAEIVDFEVDERLEPGRTVLSSDHGHVEIGLSDQIAAACEVWDEEEEPAA
ncbi:MAG: hypothetical protein AAF729_07205 [Pseudomonadota bacterium]